MLSDSFDNMSLKVNIYDKLSKIEEVFKHDEVSGYFSCNGKILENLADTTFVKEFIMEGSKISLVCNEEGGSTFVKWVRFPDFYTTDYFYMETHNWDAVTFVPKRNVKFFGFGIFASYNNKDMEYKIKYQIGDDMSEEFIYQIADAEKDPEKKWFEILLTNLGAKPVKVAADTNI